MSRTTTALDDDAGALEAFAHRLPGVTSAAELERVLCECIGVDVCVPGHDAHKRALGGLRLDPAHLAQFLWASRGLLAGARTFLHIGTNHGHSFFAITEFLRQHVCLDMDAHTVDEHNYVLTDVLPFVRPRRILHPSADLAGRHYDMVFIESGSPADYRNVGQFAGVCAWHQPMPQRPQPVPTHTPKVARQGVAVGAGHVVHTTFGDITVLVDAQKMSAPSVHAVTDAPSHA